MSRWFAREQLQRPVVRRPGRRLPASEQVGAVVAHLAPVTVAGVGLALVGRPVVWILLVVWLGPLGVWLVAGEQRPWVRTHARAALNHNLTMAVVVGLLVGALSVIGRAAWSTFFLPLLLLGLMVVVVHWVVMLALAAIEAGRGVAFTYPAALPLVGRRTGPPPA